MPWNPFLPKVPDYLSDVKRAYRFEEHFVLRVIDQEHAEHHLNRASRLDRGVFGVVQKPVIARGEIVHHEHPRYIHSAKMIRRFRRVASDELPFLHKLLQADSRCFFLGVPTLRGDDSPLPTQDRQHPLKNPFLGTRDHLVPQRNAWDGLINPAQKPDVVIWSSMIANVTMGLAPLAVRLTIRRWLEDTPYDRSDMSVANGMNLRWLIINYLDHFRIRGRLPWSRRINGDWWYPELSRPFMSRMYEIENQFLAMSAQDRDGFIQGFDWRF